MGHTNIQPNAQKRQVNFICLSVYPDKKNENYLIIKIRKILSGGYSPFESYRYGAGLKLMTDEPSSKRKKGADRPDGRRQLLVYLEASLLFDLKVKALREERPAYEIVEEALKLLMGPKDRSL